jgi:hypothetical protein
MAEWAGLFAAGKLNAAQRAFFENKPAEELFDCATDPDNVHNLAADPAARPQLLRLRAALRAHQLAIRDTGLLPEPLMVAWSAKGSPSVVAADEKRYPLARLLDQLDALQLSAQPDATALAAALRAPEPVVRYWGAVAALRATTPPDVAPLFSDAEPVVRLAAAEVVLRRGGNPAAWAVVEAALNDAASGDLRLFAVNVVARIPRPAPASVVAVLKKLAVSATAAGTENYIARAAEDLVKKAE